MAEHANDDDLDRTAEDAASQDREETEEGFSEDAAKQASDDETGEEASDDGEAAKVDPETWGRYLRITEALLFASAEPMTERMLANRLPEDADVKGLLKALRSLYDGRGVNLVRAGSSWAFRTAPDLTDYLNKEVEVARKLSRAAVETLAIIAYHQPVTRAEIEEIRGVSISKGTLDLLLEEGWVKPRGRRQTPGRPLQWGTTDEFLDHFGLETVRDLPGVDELKAAGLLDASPAINAYRSTAGITDAPSEEGASSSDEEGALPEDAFDDIDDGAAEPLDPNDGS